MARYTRQNISELKTTIKNELDQIEKEAGLKAKEQYLVNKITQFSNVKKTSLDHYVYSMATLVQELRQPFLKERQIRALSEIACSILLTHKIPLSGSRLSFLYAELYLVLSHLSQRSGHLLESLFVYRIARTSGEYIEEEKGYSNYVIATKLAQIGPGEMAMDLFSQAESEGLKIQDGLRCQLHKSKILRLLGLLEAAEDLRNTLPIDQLGPHEKIELEWETDLSHIIAGDRPIEEFIKKCQKNNLYYLPSYMIDAKLILYSLSSLKFTDKINKFSYLAKEKTFDLQGQGYIAEYGRLLEQCYHPDYTMNYKLENMGTLLTKINECASYEKRLLVLSSAARWLKHSQQWQLMDITQAQYNAQSLAYSKGKCDDPFGFFKGP